MRDRSIQEDAAPTIRALVRYGPEGPELLRRPPEETEAGSAAVELFRTVTATSFADEPYGSHRSSIHVFDDVTVVCVPADDAGGLVATVEDGYEWTAAELVDAVRTMDR